MMTAEGTHAFATFHRMKMHPGMAAEYARRVEAGALPIMRKMDGFRGYFLVAVAHDTAIAVSLFTDKAAAADGRQTLKPWLNENLGPLLVSHVEETGGEVVVSETA